MSINALFWALRAPVESPTQRAVLVAIANYADEHGRAYPSQRTLLRDAGAKSVKTVRTAIQAMQEAGLLRREERYREDGSRSSDVFHLSISEQATPPPVKNTGGVGEGLPEGGVKDTHQEPVNLTSHIEPKSSSNEEHGKSTEQPPLLASEPAETDVDFAVRIWRERCVPYGFANVRDKISADRKRQIRARIEQVGREGWEEACVKMAASPFLRGDKTDFKGNFDFLLSPRNIDKTLEGNYDDRGSTGPAQRTRTGEIDEGRRRAAVEVFAERGGFADSGVEGGSGHEGPPQQSLLAAPERPY